MAYEELEYWKKERWEEFFSALSVLSTKNNVAIKIRDKLEKEWKGKTVKEIWEKWEIFFLPEIEEVEGEQRRIKPWFLKFFDVEFRTRDNMLVNYDGILYRVEEGIGLDDVKIDFGYGSYAFGYFKRLAECVDKIIELAEKKGFEIKIITTEEPELNSPEEIRKSLISLLEATVNLTIPRNGLMFFIWSLGHGVPESYARKVYNNFDDVLIFDKLEFSKEPNYGLIKTGGFETISYQLFELIKAIAAVESDYSYEEVIDVLGVENPPTPMKDYFEQAIASFKKGEFEITKQFIRKIREVATSYAGGWRYWEGRRYNTLSSLSETLGITKGDMIRAFAPLLFLGILEYSNSGDTINNWKKWEDEWNKV